MSTAAAILGILGALTLLLGLFASFEVCVRLMSLGIGMMVAACFLIGVLRYSEENRLLSRHLKFWLAKFKKYAGERRRAKRQKKSAGKSAGQS